MQNLTIALAIWGAVGPMAGILTGHFLTRSWQREQWLMDRRKEDWQKILAALNTAVEALTSPQMIFSPVTDESTIEEYTISARFHHAIMNCIYIATDLERLNLQQRWTDACKELRTNHETALFGKEFREMKTDIIVFALKDGSR